MTQVPDYNQILPIRLTDPDVRIAIPYSGTAFAQAKLLNQWLDSNFMNTSTVTRGRLVQRGYLRTQPDMFVAKSDEILPVIINPEPISWTIGGPSGHGSVPTCVAVPIEGRWLHTQDNPRTFTQLPDSCIENLDMVDLTTAPPNLFRKWTVESGIECFKGRRGSARADLETIIGHKIRLDQLGSISLMGIGSSPRGESASMRGFFGATAPKKFKGLKISHLYRGTNKVGMEVCDVTASQVLDGRAFFLYKTNVLTINQKNTALVEETVISLGAFLDLNQMVRFKKAREFLILLQDSIQDNAERIFNPDLYEEIIGKKAKQFTTFWTGVTRIVDFQDLDDIPPVYDVVVETLENKTHIDSQTIRALNAKNAIEKSPQGKEFTNLKRFHQKLKTQTATANARARETKLARATETRNIGSNTTDIKMFEANILHLKTINERITAVTIPGLEESEKAYVEQTEALKTESKTVNKKVANAKTVYEEALKEYLEDPDAPDYFKNMLDSGIVITDLKFKSEITGKTASLQTNPELVLQEGWVFKQLLLLTTVPTRIYLDRADGRNEAIVGGPYEVRVTLNSYNSPQMAIRLAGHNSVFGMQAYGQEWHAKPHPHTDMSTVYPNIQSLTEFIAEWKKCCLGEVENIINKGMQERNPKIIIAGVLSWLSSCNTLDEWGATYHWFPKEKEVTFEREDIVPVIKAPEEPEPDDTATVADINNILNNMRTILINNQTTV